MKRQAFLAFAALDVIVQQPQDLPDVAGIVDHRDIGGRDRKRAPAQHKVRRLRLCRPGGLRVIKRGEERRGDCGRRQVLIAFSDNVCGALIEKREPALIDDLDAQIGIVDQEHAGDAV